MPAELRIEPQGQESATVPIEDRALVLGRAPECDVQIADLRLSRKHCKVELRAGRLVVQDLGSSNGTFVGGERIEQAELGAGESFVIGRTRIGFQPAGSGPLTAQSDRTERMSRGDAMAELARRQGGAPVPTDRLGALASTTPPPMQAVPAAPPSGVTMPPPPSAGSGAWPAPPPPLPPAAARAPSSSGAFAPPPLPPPPAPLSPAAARAPSSSGAFAPLPPAPAAAPPPAPAPAPAPAPPPSPPPAKSAAPSSTRLVEGYDVIEQLGKGSMGTVYRVRAVDSGDICVLKTIEFSGSSKDAIFFIRECQAGMKIKHPNVVELLDFGESSGLLFLAMELVDGGNLLQRIKQVGKLPEAEAVYQLRKIAEALTFAFKKKIVHRDIKPANILLTREGEPKLADFGLAKTMLDGQRKGLTQQGETRGTPIYMPPEMLMSASDADQRADIYSLGATYYHAITGQHPFRANTVPQILRMVVQSEPTPIEQLRNDVSPALIGIVRKMMAKKPEDRFQTPAELCDVLARLG